MCATFAAYVTFAGRDGSPSRRSMATRPSAGKTSLGTMIRARQLATGRIGRCHLTHRPSQDQQTISNYRVDYVRLSRTELPHSTLCSLLCVDSKRLPSLDEADGLDKLRQYYCLPLNPEDIATSRSRSLSPIPMDRRSSRSLQDSACMCRPSGQRFATLA